MNRAKVIGLLGAIVIALTGSARAADTASISVTVSLEAVISVSVTPGAWNIGAIALGGTNGPSPFTASVGNTATKLEIVGTDGAGAWALGAAAGADQFAVAVSSPAISLSKAYQTLSASVAAYGSKAFDLTYSAPASDTKGGGVSQNFTITIKASAP